ncbi:hypothetical protein QBC35DRAFT_220108 [Podospora australis]|uniref:Uncharacterized protein n=1 Tax=Podospora australis TaxID=1536484 RepID=A0AAN7AGJ2_9PEZI|nr:hypothetical protein QBC35DRAFT_220108 [Podospora australis]
MNPKANPPPKTQDGHHILVNGRKWRATDPMIPGDALAELKHYLAKGRSGTRRRKGSEDDEERLRKSRQITGLAKLGLGERGTPEWWNDTDEGRKQRWETALSKLRELQNQNQ